MSSKEEQTTSLLLLRAERVDEPNARAEIDRNVTQFDKFYHGKDRQRWWTTRRGLSARPIVHLAFRSTREV